MPPLEPTLLPEYIIEYIIEITWFIKEMAPDEIESEYAEYCSVLMTLVMGSGNYFVNNPHLRGQTSELF